MYGANVIIFEGILTFYNPDICDVSRERSIELKLARICAFIIDSSAAVAGYEGVCGHGL